MCDRPRGPDGDGLHQGLLDGIYVLVVEDDPGLRETLSMTLTYYGALVTTAGSVREALAVLRQVLPHIILTDLTLRDGDGYALLRQIRGAPETGRIPVVAVTGFAALEEADAAREFEAYLEKPVNPSTLCRLIRRLADERRS
jgi:CheY-like chemotaxis protein